MGDATETLLPNRRKNLSRSISHAQDELHSFRSYLKWMCVDQSSCLTACLSWSMFILFAIVVPAISHFVLACDTCDGTHTRPYDGVVQLSLSSVATLSFVCLSGFVKKFGLRRFLFFDKLCDESETVRSRYMEQLNRSLKILCTFVLPCFLVESAYKIWWYASGASQIPFLGNVYLSDIRDPLQSDIIQLLSSCTCQLLQLFASRMLNQSQKPATFCQLGALDTQKQSVGTKFKSQLFKLMNQLENTRPHFIRCIKPNGKQLPGIYEEDLVLQQLRCCGVLEMVRISRSGYPNRMTHQEFAGRFGFLLSEKQLSQDPLSISVAVLQQFNVLPEMYQVGYTKVYLRSGQLGALEDRRKQVLQGIIRLQKCFRGYRARSRFHELSNGVITLQSFARGDNIRRRYASAAKRCSSIAPKNLDEQLTAIIFLQSATRGWLVRKHFNMHKLKQSNHVNAKFKQRPGWKSSDMKDVPQEQVQALPSALAELQRRVFKAEATLGQKEEENAALHQQLQQYEAKWLEYESKMKSMEEMWQKQMPSLQMSLAAARKSLASDNTAGEPGRLDASTSPRFYDSEGTMSMGSRTPGGSTPMKFTNAVADAGARRETNGSLTAVNSLTKEFEQRRQNFDEGAKALVEIKTAQPASNMHPDVELRKLKLRFETWKKDYKARLRETKVRVNKLGNSEVEKTRRKWWEKISSRVQ